VLLLMFCVLPALGAEADGLVSVAADDLLPTCCLLGADDAGALLSPAAGKVLVTFVEMLVRPGALMLWLFDGPCSAVVPSVVAALPGAPVSLLLDVLLAGCTITALLASTAGVASCVARAGYLAALPAVPSRLA
jgi:hypothetical protein